MLVTSALCTGILKCIFIKNTNVNLGGMKVEIKTKIIYYISIYVFKQVFAKYPLRKRIRCTEGTCFFEPSGCLGWVRRPSAWLDYLFSHVTTLLRISFPFYFFSHCYSFSVKLYIKGSNGVSCKNCVLLFFS